jgi:hypothetical protein
MTGRLDYDQRGLSFYMEKLSWFNINVEELKFMIAVGYALN